MMRLTIRRKFFLGMVAFSLGLILLSLFITNRFMGNIADQERTHNLQRGQRAYERFTVLQHNLIAAKARSLAQTPHLRAVMNIPGVDHETVSYTADELKKTSEMDLMLLVDAQGNLLTDLKSTTFVGHDLRAFAGITAGLNGAEYKGFWNYRGTLYQIALMPIVLENQILGILVLGNRLNAAAAEEIREVTGKDVLLLHDGKIIGQSRENSGSPPIERGEIGDLFFRLDRMDPTNPSPFSTTLGTKACLALAMSLGDVEGQVVLFRSLDEFENELGALRTSLLVGGGLSVFLALLLSLWLSERVSRPIRELGNAAEQFGAGNFDKRVSFSSRDELGQLARSFNLMADNVEERTTALRGANTQLQKEMADRKRVDEALLESEEKLRGLVENIPDGVCLLDGDHRLTAANPAAHDFLEVLAPEMNGNISSIGGYSLEDIGALQESGLSQEVTTKGPPHQVFEVGASTISEGNAEGGWVVVIREVTREREVQERVQQQGRLAAVGQLAAGISHDFNNLLTGINGFSQLLVLRPDIPDSAKEILETINDQGVRAAQLIRQILDFSRKTVVQREPVSLVPFLKETVRLLERTLPETITIQSHLDGEDHTIEANLTQLQQVLTNLAVNARDAMPTGGTFQIQLSSLKLGKGDTSPSLELKPGDWTVLKLSDTGTGIPPQVLEHIFEPFFTTKAPGSGTGLGLAQVYGIIKQHGGSIDVESDPGRGTTFSIYLPQTGKSEPSSQAPVLDIPRGEGETVLVVEDEKSVQMVVQGMLEGLNYKVLLATNGNAALSIYDAHQDEIALVLTDVVMPEMGGIDLLKALKEKNNTLPVMLMTGYPLGNPETPLPQGIQGCLQKPLNMKEVGQTVHDVLKKAGSGVSSSV